MQTRFAEIIADSGCAALPIGTITRVVRYVRTCGFDGTNYAYGLVVGDGVIEVPAAAVEIIDSAEAKRRRVNRKRDADRAAPTWRGPEPRSEEGSDVTS